jgi:hypothetical protein
MGIHALQLVSGLRNRMEIEVSEQEPISTAPKRWFRDRGFVQGIYRARGRILPGDYS